MKYKVGDRVKVREWDDMAAEYGVNKDGWIKTEYAFTPVMKKFCGTTQTVREVFSGSYHMEDGEGWSFTDDMLLDADEPAPAPKKPRLAEVLGVEVGQVFEVEGHGGVMYRINVEGRREWCHKRDERWDISMLEHSLVDAINDPSLIRIVRPWTDKDVAAAKAVRQLWGTDYGWVARDKDGSVWVYANEPSRENNEFVDIGDNISKLPDTAFSSVTWENSPVRIADILEGEETNMKGQTQ